MRRKTLYFSVREELASLFCKHFDWEFCLQQFYRGGETLKAFQTEAGAIEAYRTVASGRDDFAILAIEIDLSQEGLSISQIGSGSTALWELSSDTVERLKPLVTYQHVWMRPKWAVPHPAGSVPIDPAVIRGLMMRGL